MQVGGVGRKRNYFLSEVNALPSFTHGKLQQTITLVIFGKLLDRADLVDRCGYPAAFIKALLVALYWSGFRISEWIGAISHKTTRKDGSVHYTPPFPALIKEQMWVDETNKVLFVRQVARKNGHRDSPIQIPLDLPYVNLLVDRWQKTAPGKPVFPISNVTWWRILKRIDPKLYSHFFIMNRLTKQAEDREISLKEQEDWSGKSPATIARYRAHAGRDTQHAGERMKYES